MSYLHGSVYIFAHIHREDGPSYKCGSHNKKKVLFSLRLIVSINVSELASDTIAIPSKVHFPTTVFTFFLFSFSSSLVLAHWNYNHLIVDGAIAGSGSSWEYIRRTNNTNAPLQAVNSTDMRCNSGGSSGVALNTSTLTVAAGSEIGFGIDETFGHPGPQVSY